MDFEEDTWARVCCVIFAQLRAIRVLLQLRQRGETVAMAAARECTSPSFWLAASLAGCVVSFITPSVEALVATAGATLIFNCIGAPDEVDNGGCWEWCMSAFLSIAPLASVFSGGTLIDGLLQILPYFKLSFTFVYAAAGFAKLNTDFLNYRTSSNTIFLIKLLASPPFVGPPGIPSSILSDAMWRLIFRAALVLLAVTELAIPIFFWMHMPCIGAAINWIFHLFVGAAAYNFSCSGTGALPFVLPMDSAVHGYGFMTVSLPSRSIALCVTCALALSQWPKPGAPDAYNRVHGLCSMRTGSFEKNSIHATWLGWAIVLAVGIRRQCICIATGAIDDDEEAVATFASTLQNPIVDAVGLFISTVFLITCLAPYLGIKTHSTFSMFSNLRCEGGISNHILFRAWMQPFGFLADMVTVTATNHERIRHFMRGVGGIDTMGSMKSLVVRESLDCTIYGQLKRGRGIAGSDETNTVFPYSIPYIQLRSLIAESTQEDFFVEYEHKKATHRFVLDNGNVVHGGDARLRARLPMLLRPWIFCRALQPNDNTGLCYH